MTDVDLDLQNESVELLQQLIRNQCVNDGTPESGNEDRSADILQHVLEGAGLDVARYTSAPGRTSVVARIEGSDPTAPKVCLMGHTDVVPVNPAGWTQDPFGGELIGDEVWGRGAIDMLNLTATMAVGFRHLARTGFRPRGDLIFFGVADEENGGHYGAKWMLDNHWDAIACDYVLTESGGTTAGHRDGRRRVGMVVGEKGIAWRRLRITGTPAHGSMPWQSDNAVVKAAEIVRRLATYQPAAQISDIWRSMVEAMPVDESVRAQLLDPGHIRDALSNLPHNVAKHAHACTHTTFSPNVMHGGSKTNIIPDSVEIEVDIRTVPGTTSEDVTRHIEEALGDMVAEVEISPLQDGVASASPTDNPMWDCLQRQVHAVDPNADIFPTLLVGGTDARFFREKGVVGFGAGLFSPNLTMKEFGSRFHGHDERIDVGSLGLTAGLWVGVAKDLLG
jgi:acetylornithine deacetylase/succinyl-diaminopimelate desuccinylase-like protein